MKTTKKQFELFKKYCLEYQRQWELTDWKLFFTYENIGDNIAQVKLDLEAKQVTVGFNSELPKGTVPGIMNDIKSHAKHEMLHILLGRFSELSQYRYIQYRELESAGHEIVNKLMKLIP